MTSARGLRTISTIAAKNRPDATRKKILDPNRYPSFAPSIINPDTPTEHITIAVPIVVGGVSTLFTIPLVEIGIAYTLNGLRACPIAITTIGNLD